jgi:isoleucyl-tRNA synthetase
MGIDKFVNACRDYVSEVSSEWRWYVDHIGRWADMDNAYRTMDQDYMETVVWIFKNLYEKGLIYEGMRSSLYCPRCATPLSKFEVTMDDGFYRDVEDTAVTIKFKVAGEDKYLLAWTTTPWTLPGNRALVVDEEAEYVEVATEKGERVILAGPVYEKDENFDGKVVGRMKGKELVGLKYEPLYEYGPRNENDFKVYGAQFVTMEEGVGIVHIAPAFGEDDFSLGQEVGLSVFVSVDEEGKVTDEVSQYRGKYYKKTNALILADLSSRGLVFREGKITHSYPFCYRCETALIYKAQKAWYMKIDGLREQLMKSNKDINWVPEHFREGRFDYNLRTAPDWCLSRSRYWGTPIPAWKCDGCDHLEVLGSKKEVEEKSGQRIGDWHRPDIDEISWDCKCGGKMMRVPEILDVWF